jgi:hypothetical protein
MYVFVTPSVIHVENTWPTADEGAKEGYEYTDDRGTRETGAEEGGMMEEEGAGA